MSQNCLEILNALPGLQVCINGGPISQVEQAEMPMIVRAATLDAQRSGVRCAIAPIKKLSLAKFCDFCNTGLATTVAQHQSEKDRLVQELEQLRATHKAELRDVMQERDKVAKQKEEAAAECALLKKQLSTRDTEVAQLRARLEESNSEASGHQQSALQSVHDHVAAVPGISTELPSGSSSAAVYQPGYMELLGWTIKRRRVGQQDRPTQSDDLWHSIFSQETARIASRNAGELVQDSELLYQCAVPRTSEHARAVPVTCLYPSSVVACLDLDT